MVVSLKTPRPRGWVGAGRPSGCKSSFNKRNMYQYPHVSQLFILLPWQSRVYPEPLKVVEFVQLTTECCWGQPSDPCQRGCLTSHACVMWGPRTLNADDDDDDECQAGFKFIRCNQCGHWVFSINIIDISSSEFFLQYISLLGLEISFQTWREKTDCHSKLHKK